MPATTNLLNRSAIVTTGDLGGRKLIQDVMTLKVISKKETVVEGTGGVKKFVKRLGGQFQFADRANANGRIYERPVLEAAVRALQEDIGARRVLGELDHPADAKIHMDRVSHLISRLWIEENGGVFGELEILRGTIMGDQLAALVDNGVTVGISSRGVGDLEDVMVEGQVLQRVMPGYTLVTFDVVGEPSVDGSFLSVVESKQKGVKSAVTKRDAEKALVEEFKRTLKSGRRITG
jgi:phage head maturation protease